MPRPRSEEWDYFQGDGNVKCNKCSSEIVNARVDKLRRHIIHHCKGWVANDRNAFIQRLENKRRRTALDKEQVVDDDERGSQKMSQDTFNKMVAEFIFDSGSALFTMELPCFQSLALQGRPGLKVPPRHLVTGRLLDEKFEVEFDEFVELLQLQPFVSLAVDDSANVCDQNGVNFVNFVLGGPNMTPRLWTTLVARPDELTGPGTAQMIADIIDEVEEARGKPGFVTACTADNIQAIRAAATILEDERGVFCTTGCPSQTLKLLIEDIIELGPVWDTLNKSHSLANYFLQRRQLLARFDEEQAKLHKLRNDGACTLALTLPVASRWYSVYSCISSVIENKDVIAVVFEDLEFMKRFQTEPTTGTKKKSPTTENENAPSTQNKTATGKRKRSAENQSASKRNACDQDEGRKKNWMSFADANAVVQDQDFWELGQQVLKLLATIVEKIDVLETDGCSIGEVYATFAELLKSPLYCRTAVLADTAAEIMSLVQSRWKLLQTDAMGISFLLDPTKDPDDFMDGDCNAALKHVRVVADRLGYDEATQGKAFREANAFVNMKRDWTPDEKTKQGDVPPVEWWGNHRKYYPALFDIARRVFTIPTSSAAANISWSTHEYINSLLQEGVKHETLRKLVFIYANRNAGDADPEMIENIESAPNQGYGDSVARNDATSPLHF